LWLHSLKVAQLLLSAAYLHTNQSRSYLNHLVCWSLACKKKLEIIQFGIRIADGIVHSKLEQLFDTLEVPPANQLAAPTCCAQFCPLYTFYIEEFPNVFQHARDQYIKQSFHTITYLIKVCAFVVLTCSNMTWEVDTCQ